MYNQDYDEYMRDVLGYGFSYPYPEDDVPETLMLDEELEECYPDIYKIVYPMVQKVCMRNTKPITKRLIDDMVNEVFINVEPNDSININVNLGNTVKTNNLSGERENKTVPKPEVKSKYVRENRESTEEKNHIKETRQRNFLLNDLIRILVLRELIGRPSRPGNRPPQRPPIRPPYPGPGGRPPIRPRGEFDPYYGIYEY